MRKAARLLCLLPVTECRGLGGGVHLDTRLPAPSTQVRAVRGLAWRAGLRPLLEKRVEVRLLRVQYSLAHDANVGGPLLPWMLHDSLRQWRRRRASGERSPIFYCKTDAASVFHSRLCAQPWMPGAGEYLRAVRGPALPGRVIGLLAVALGEALLQLRRGGMC